MRSRDPDAELAQPAPIRFWERLLAAAFGLMLVGSELPSRWDALTRAFGWIIVAAAGGSLSSRWLATTEHEGG
jgi:hypothetical protein